MESIIFNVNEINKVNFSEVIQTPQNLVYSIDKTKTYVTWVSSTTPDFVSTMTTYEGPFTQSELLSILERPEWLLIV
jgi:hypothetical protein